MLFRKLRERREERERKERQKYNIYYVELSDILKHPVWSDDKYTTLRIEVYNVNKTITQCRNEAIKIAKQQKRNSQIVKGIVNYFEYNK
jgi:hypothetical protein